MKPSNASRLVFLLYCFSGFLSLVYQVVWFRSYVDHFGATNLTFAVVLCNFILGLGAGALASKPIANRLARWLSMPDRLRVYGVVELLIGAAVMLTAVLKSVRVVDLWPFPYTLTDGIYRATLLYQGSELVIATVCVFVPCFLMGVTFPLLCQVFEKSDKFPAALYAWNTLGACTGVVVCQMLFLPIFGHDQTLWIAAAANLLLGGFFLVVGGAPDVASESTAAESTSPQQPQKPQSQKPSSPKKKGKNRRKRAVQGEDSGRLATLPHAGTLLALAIFSGLFSGALEGDMFKRIAFLGGNSSAGMSFISFWAILGIFFASWIVRNVSRIRLLHIKIAYAAALGLYIAAWRLAYPIQDGFLARDKEIAIQLVPNLEFVDSRALALFPTNMWQLLFYVGVIVFPAFLLTSLLFPYVCNRIQGLRRHQGITYGSNTVAFCIGMIAFSIIAPRVNIFYSLKLFLVFFAIGVGLLALISEFRSLPLWKPIIALVVFAFAATMVPTDFDPSYLRGYDPDNPRSGHTRKEDVRALKSNGAHTTYVVKDSSGDRLYFDNYSMSGTALDSQRYMRLMAHFPLLAHSNPKSALLICFGVGNTASAIAAHDTIENIDIVDLNHRVFETAKEFKATNGGVYLDPRVRLIHDDGRNFLNMTDQKYDLITSEPPPPMHAGVYRLYSKEYYEQAMAHLTEQGFMTQWLPTYQMSAEAVDLSVRTFIDVFPNAMLITNWRDFILVGSRSPIDMAQIERRFYEPPKVVADLRRVGIKYPMHLIARVVQGDGELRRNYAGDRIISDQHNDLSHLYGNPADPPVISYNPQRLLEDIQVDRLKMGPHLRDVVMHLGRLQYWITDFPESTLMSVKTTDAEGVALRDVNWRKLRRRQIEFILALRAKNVRKAITLNNEILAMHRQVPSQLIKLATLLRNSGENQEAIKVLKEFLAIESGDPNIYSLLGDLYVRVEQYQQAKPVLRRALDELPTDALVHCNMGIVMVAEGKAAPAMRHFDEAMRLRPNRPRYPFEKAKALIRFGKPREAIRLLEPLLIRYPNDKKIRDLHDAIVAKQSSR